EGAAVEQVEARLKHARVDSEVCVIAARAGRATCNWVERWRSRDARRVRQRDVARNRRAGDRLLCRVVDPWVAREARRLRGLAGVRNCGWCNGHRTNTEQAGETRGNVAVRELHPHLPRRTG